MLTVTTGGRSWNAWMCRSSVLCLLLLGWCQIVVSASASLFEDDDDEFSWAPRTRRSLQTQETERVNILQKLRESIGLTIFGLLLICCLAPFVIWRNEGRHVRELARIDYCKNQAVVVADPTSPTANTNECLVHFTGKVQVVDKNDKEDNDDKLDLTTPIPHALVVKRTVYIYQKFEVAERSVNRDRIGGGETRTTTYSVREDWTARGPQAASLEHIPGETNSRGIWDDLVQVAGTRQSDNPSPVVAQLPDAMAEMLGLHDENQPPHRQAVATTVHVGGFALKADVILGHPGAFLADMQPVPAEYLPDVPKLVKGSDGVLQTFDQAVGPQNGDVKIVYEYATDGFDCSFLVRQVAPATDDLEAQRYGVAQCHAVKEQCFGAWDTDLGDVWMVHRGTHDVAAMIVTAKQEEAAMNKLVRIVGWILLFVGWIMLFSPFVTALEVLPILSNLGFFAVVLVALTVSALCCSTLTLLAYFRYRPLLSGSLLALALGIWAIVIWRLDEAAEEGGSVDD